MPSFHNGVYNAGSYEKSIAAALKDLATDYPGSHVFICSANLKPGVSILWAIPPDSTSHVVTGHFEIHSTQTLVKTWGYKYIIFSEGEFRYKHPVG